jgi:hypothetical protein
VDRSLVRGLARVGEEVVVLLDIAAALVGDAVAA